MTRMKMLGAWLAAVAASLASLAAHAGGPLGVCYGQPIKYPGAGSITLNYDQGNLGARTKSQMDALVTNAVSLWTNVPTSTVSITRGADLPVNVTTANYSTYWNSFGDGLNPVVYDTDGSITDLVFGAGSKSSVLGVAGSAWYDYGSSCQYAEGRALINGSISVSDATMTNVIAHEVGHLIGMDHSQLDATQGLSSANFPLMYPIAYRSLASLHEDDAAAVSALYPDSGLNSAYGQLTGTFTQANGTPVRGANIWAQGAGGVFSIVSDYLEQATGYFRLYLPPGTYTLHAEAIASQFNGGSSVGPYSETSSGRSFQSPLYVGGSPMAPVTLGNASPVQITITAGCQAAVTFRMDGTGTPTGNCGSAPSGAASTMTSPAAGSTLSSSSVTFSWSAGTSVTERYLSVGTTSGGSQIYGAYQAGALSRTVSGLPTNGSTVYVRLMSFVNGAWQANNYTYTSMTATPAPTPPPSLARSDITSPAAGSTLSSSSVTFSWTSGTNVTERYLAIGSSFGGSNYYSGYQGGALSATVAGLPTNGSTVYVRLMSYINGAWQTGDYMYTATTSSTPPVSPRSEITSPAAGGTLSGSSVTFSWTSGTGVGERYLAIGSSVGGSNYYGGYQGSAMSRVVSTLPTDGSTVHVRLMSYISGAWQIADYTYTAASGGGGGGSPASALTSPAPGSRFTSSTVTFNWTAGTGIAERYFAVGSSVGGSNYYGGYQGGALTRTVSGLPTNGSTVYVRLMSYINGAWVVNDYTYTAQ